jgi:CubicO group peptidase (beta-lactamase class C family)
MKALHQVEQWPATTAAVGWIDLIGHRETWGPTSRPFPLASLTKPLFAYAVLIAVEEGTLGLDQPAGPPGSTIEHLLAHASGLGEQPDDRLFGVGQRRIYSNGGFEVLGRELARAAGMSAARYVHEAVAEPLGLRTTELTGSPAHGAVSSLDDLLIVAAEWLAPTLISATTMTRATTPRFPQLAGVLPGFGRQEPNPWGLGFELKGAKEPHWTGAANSPATFGHFGRSGTFVWVDPVAAVACVALTDLDFGPWAIDAWPALSDAVLTDATAEVEAVDAPGHRP